MDSLWLFKLPASGHILKAPRRFRVPPFCCRITWHWKHVPRNNWEMGSIKEVIRWFLFGLFMSNILANSKAFFHITSYSLYFFPTYNTKLILMSGWDDNRQYLGHWPFEILQNESWELGRNIKQKKYDSGCLYHHWIEETVTLHDFCLYLSHDWKLVLEYSAELPSLVPGWAETLKMPCQLFSGERQNNECLWYFFVGAL